MGNTQCRRHWCFLSIVPIVIFLLRFSTAMKRNQIHHSSYKEKYLIWWLMVSVLFHYHHDKHGRMQSYMVLGKEVRINTY